MMEGVNELGDALPSPARKKINVEICLHLDSTARSVTVKQHVLSFLDEVGTVYGDTNFNDFMDPFLMEHVKSISIVDTDIITNNTQCQMIDLAHYDIQFHVFQLHMDGPANEEIEEEDLAAASLWVLPAMEFHGIWENLIFDSSIKFQLLNYTSSALLFSDKDVDPNVVTWNKVVLLHDYLNEDCLLQVKSARPAVLEKGPPGTGKTSLCKALAQKLTIRLSDRFRYGQLIEINSHSLFSKWFSESGKLVMKMFQRIQDLIDDPEALVCVLIDEVESLTAARSSAMKGSEPSDAIRVVNALLTQIDQIKRHPNVLILTTSNITGAIDLAFVDRADIKQYIGPPSHEAIYRIYHSCINELSQKGIISPTQQILSLRSLEVMRYVDNGATNASLKLLDIARKSHGLSGRTLRKLPFLAHALYIQSSSVTLSEFLSALFNAVEKQLHDRDQLTEEQPLTSPGKGHPALPINGTV